MNTILRKGKAVVSANKMKRMHLRKLLVFAIIFCFIVTTVIGFASEGVKNEVKSLTSTSGILKRFIALR